MDIAELKKEYSKRRSEIRERLSEFAAKRKVSADDLFIELCYCLCTPVSKAEKVYERVNKENKSLLLNAGQTNVSSFLRGTCRFHRNKAKYIIEARALIKMLKNLPNDPFEARELLVREVKGFGYKEASHFLRNIGYRGLAILDGHILHSLHKLRVLKTDERPKSRKEYLATEEKMKKFARKIGIDLDELDLLFWSMRTGKVLK
jgi:N-glycosylase/DNA lyase